MTKKALIIGSLPSPIGGVSTFCERFSWFMLNKGFDVIFIDLYSGNKSSDLLNYNRFSYINIFKSRKTVSYLLLIYQVLCYGNRKVYFNFSTAKSIYFLGFLSIIVRLRGGKSNLILHHGNLILKHKIGNIIKSFINVFNNIKYISDNQKRFYKELGFKGKLDKLELYFPPLHKSKLTVRNGYPRNILISGSEDEYYNVISTLNSLMRFSKKHDIFINISVVTYGRCSNEFIESLRKIYDLSLNQNSYSIKCYQDLSEKDFIYLLSGQELYIRNNSVDSFGIIVADALNIGVKVLASDVCKRYPGTTVFNYIDKFSFIKGLSKLYDVN